MKPGDVVIGVLPGAIETKARPAVVIASEEYIRERPDVLLGIVTSRAPAAPALSDCILNNWKQAGLRREFWFRAYVITMRQRDVYVVGRLSASDWDTVRACVRSAIAR